MIFAQGLGADAPTKLIDVTPELLKKQATIVKIAAVPPAPPTPGAPTKPTPPPAPAVPGIPTPPTPPPPPEAPKSNFWAVVGIAVGGFALWKLYQGSKR